MVINPSVQRFGWIVGQQAIIGKGEVRKLSVRKDADHDSGPGTPRGENNCLQHCGRPECLGEHAREYLNQYKKKKNVMYKLRWVASPNPILYRAKDSSPKQELEIKV